MNRDFIQEVGVGRWVWRTAIRQFTKRVLRSDLHMRLPTGKRIFLPITSQAATETFVTNASQDWGAEALFARFAERDADAIDAGAHIGYYSLYLSPLVRRTFAFEPDPRNFHALLINAQTGGNIEHFAEAVSDHVGTARFDFRASSSSNAISEDGAAEVAVTTIDQFVAARPGARIRLIKTDVEGHDLATLHGARATIRSDQPLIVSEIGPDEVAAFSREIEYEVWTKLKHGRAKMTFLVPRRLAREFAAEAAASGFFHWTGEASPPT